MKLKMLTTQLTGHLTQVSESAAYDIEETARLLAQVLPGEGTIYFVTVDELTAIEAQALSSDEPFQFAKRFESIEEVTHLDRVLLIGKDPNDERLLTIARQLNEAFIPFAAIANGERSADNPLADLAYTYVSLNVKRGLLPNEAFERVVHPYLWTALYYYDWIKLLFDEIAREENDDDFEIPASPFA